MSELMRFKVRAKGKVIILDLEGEIRLIETPELSLQRLIRDHLEEGKNHLLLNFKGVEFIDSYGIGDVLASFITTRHKGGKLKITGLSEKIWLIFNYSGLNRIIEIFDNEEEALASFT